LRKIILCTNHPYNVIAVTIYAQTIPYVNNATITLIVRASGLKKVVKKIKSSIEKIWHLHIKANNEVWHKKGIVNINLSPSRYLFRRHTNLLVISIVKKTDTVLRKFTCNFIAKKEI